jgi:hypothetical protein
VQPVIDGIGLIDIRQRDVNRDGAIGPKRGNAIRGWQLNRAGISGRDTTAHEERRVFSRKALQGRAVEGLGIDMEIFTAVRILVRPARVALRWNEPLRMPNQIGIRILGRGRRKAQVVQLHLHLVTGGRDGTGRRRHLLNARFDDIELRHVRAAQAIRFVFPVARRVGDAIDRGQPGNVHR